jgi:hypothetical protein
MEGPVLVIPACFAVFFGSWIGVIFLVNIGKLSSDKATYENFPQSFSEAYDMALEPANPPLVSCELDRVAAKPPVITPIALILGAVVGVVLYRLLGNLWGLF